MKRNNKLIIGITGGIGTGKSTVSKILKNKGYAVIDADKVARKVLEIGKKGYEEVVEYFGENIIAKDGSIDRMKLGDIVFGDDEELKKINDIVHPHVYNEIKKQINLYAADNNIVFLDIPLLIEEQDELCANGINVDEIWLVYADRNTQFNRILKRDNLNENQVKYRIDSQLSIEQKKDKANFIIDNRGDLRELEFKINRKLRNYKV